MAFVTWGEQGASAIACDTGEIVHCNGYPAGGTGKVVETIGAGDTFIGAVIGGYYSFNTGAGFTSGLLKQCLEFACQVAANKCGKL